MGVIRAVHINRSSVVSTQLFKLPKLADVQVEALPLSEPSATLYGGECYTECSNDAEAGRGCEAMKNVLIAMILVRLNPIVNVRKGDNITSGFLVGYIV